MLGGLQNDTFPRTHVTFTERCLFPMILTCKQALFAEHLAGGLNRSASYRAVYNARGMSADSIKVEAHRLSRHPKIVWAVDRLRKGCPSTKRVVSDLHPEWIKIRLMDLADSPYSTTSQKISALEFLGKNLGMF